MASESTTTISPPSNPFSSDGGDEGVKFDAFSLSPSSGGGGAKSSSMPSLQSIQQQEQQQQQMQQQQNQQQPPPPQQQQEMKFDSLPSPEELSGPMNDTSKPSTTTTSNQGSNNNWPPPSSSTTNTYGLQPNNTNLNNNNNQSFLAKLLTCGGLCSIETLRPYFDIDTADIFVRMKGSIQYVLVMNGFRNEVLYSDNAFRLAYRDTTTSGGGGNGEDGDGEDGGEGEGSSSRFTPPALQSPSTTSSGKGADLYGPIWITLTLVFFVAVTSNISLYIHHTTSNKRKSTIVDEGGIAAEEEWDYDINQLLHATWILYSFSMGLPTLLYFMLRLIGGGAGGNSNLGLVELICLYGYSLVPYLPMTWLCIVPYGWVQWLVLSVATVLSGMLVLRNVAGSILDTSGGGGGGVGGLQKKGGSLLMCIVGFHLIFLLVMKLAFYHHS